MIQLTPEQSAGLDGLLTPAFDPVANQSYMLVAEAEFRRLQELDDEVDYGPWTDEELAAAHAAICDMLDEDERCS